MRNLQLMRKLFYGITNMWGVSSELGRYRSGSEMQNVDSFSSAWMMVEDGLIVGLGGDEGVYGADYRSMGDVQDMEHIDLCRYRDWETAIKEVTG